MNINNRVGLTLALILLSAGTVTAQPKPTTQPQRPTPSPTISTQQREELEKLQQEKEIRDRVQNEVDRAFSYTTAMLNILLVVLTLLPILAAAGVWLLRRSVISEIVAETKQQLKTEVETQLEKEVAAELQKQAQAFKEELEIVKSDFIAQLSQLNKLFLDAQNQKEQILQQLAIITPSPSFMPDFVNPDIQHKVQELTTQLEILKNANPQIFFTANDYLKQGDALFLDNRYEEALSCYNLVIQKQVDPDLTCLAWINHGWALIKLRRYEEAALSYKQSLAIQSDKYISWHGLGNALRKLGRYDEALTAYDKVIELQPDFDWTWYRKACCYALQGNNDLAIANLQQAIILGSEKHRELAKNDSDFDAIREDERFQKLIEG